MSRVTKPAKPAGGTMQADTGEIQALRAEVAELAARIDQLDRAAFQVRTFDELRLERADYTGTPQPARTGWHRHLRSVDGSAS